MANKSLSDLTKKPEQIHNNSGEEAKDVLKELKQELKDVLVVDELSTIVNRHKQQPVQTTTAPVTQPAPNSGIEFKANLNLSELMTAKDKLIQEQQKATTEAQNQYFAKMVEIADKAQAKAESLANTDPMESLATTLEAFERIRKMLTPASVTQSAASHMTFDQVMSLKLKEQEHEALMEESKRNHEVTMLRLQKEIANSNRDFEIRMEELKEDRQRRYAELTASKEHKDKIFDEMGDLFHSIGKSVQVEKNNEAPDSKINEQGPEHSDGIENERTIRAEIASFVCLHPTADGPCNNEITVEPGSTEVKCEKCNTRYRLS